MAGTQSVWADDPGILGIPRSRQTVAIIYPQHGSDLEDFPFISEQGSHEAGELERRHLHRVNVVRVQPRTSGSITDLLLALACVLLAANTAPQRS